MTISELADFLATDPVALLNGNYRNRRGHIGYFVQLKCGDHSVKVSVSNVASIISGISPENLDAMTKEDLISEAPFIVPLQRIAKAIHYIGDRGVEWKRYRNANFVPGVWLEEKAGEHWYMVSVSHVEGLESVPQEHMDEPADEFLRRMGAFGENVRPVTRRQRSRWA